MFDYGRVVHIDEAIVDGELVVVRCRSTGTLTLLGSGMTVEAVAREVFTLQNVSGRWMVRFYMNNVPRPIGSG
jgi:predicted methyltransferase MtxX (methanogen marker protein 4)